MTSWIRNQIAILYNTVSITVAATPDMPAEKLQSVCESDFLLYNIMMDNSEYGRQRLKDIVVEKETREKEEETVEQTKDRIDLTGIENEGAFEGTPRSFVIPGTPKTKIDAQLEQAKPHTKASVEDYLKEMQSAKVIMTLWVRQKRYVKVAITLDPKVKLKIQKVILVITTSNQSFLKVVILKS